MENMTFYSYEHIKLYLENIISNLNDVYNIFLHEVGDYSLNSYLNFPYDTSLRADGIMKQGLLLSEYGSICGTMNFVGNNKNIDINNVLKYNYYSHLRNKYILVIAIPKYIDLNGKMVEFSSYKGQTSRQEIEELETLYHNYGGAPILNHKKFCLYDVVKNAELDKCFHLGILNINEGENKYNFKRNLNHISEKDAYNDYLFEQYEQKIKEACKKFRTKNVLELIVKASKEEEKWWNAKDDWEV